MGDRNSASNRFVEKECAERLAWRSTRVPGESQAGTIPAHALKALTHSGRHAGGSNAPP